MTNPEAEIDTKYIVNTLKKVPTASQTIKLKVLLLLTICWDHFNLASSSLANTTVVMFSKRGNRPLVVGVHPCFMSWLQHKSNVSLPTFFFDINLSSGNTTKNSIVAFPFSKSFTCEELIHSAVQIALLVFCVISFLQLREIRRSAMIYSPHHLYHSVNR